MDKKIILNFKEIENFYLIIKNLEVKNIFITIKNGQKFAILKCIDNKGKLICNYKLEILDILNIDENYFVGIIPSPSNILLTKNNNGIIEFIFKKKNLLIKTKYVYEFYNEENKSIKFNTINNSSHIFTNFAELNETDNKELNEIGYFIIHSSEIKDLLKIFSEKMIVKIYTNNIIKFDSIKKSSNPINQKKTFILKENISENIIFELDKSFLNIKSFTLNFNQNKIKIFENIKATLFHNKINNYHLFMFTSNKTQPIKINNIEIPINEIVEIYSYETIKDEFLPKIIVDNV